MTISMHIKIIEIFFYTVFILHRLNIVLNIYKQYKIFFENLTIIFYYYQIIIRF